MHALYQRPKAQYVDVLQRGAHPPAPAPKQAPSAGTGTPQRASPSANGTPLSTGAAPVQAEGRRARPADDSGGAAPLQALDGSGGPLPEQAPASCNGVRPARTRVLMAVIGRCFLHYQ